MTWHMEILRISLKEQVLIIYYVINVILRDITFSWHDTAKNRKYDGYQKGLALMVIIFQINIPHVVVLEMKIYQTSN